MSNLTQTPPWIFDLEGTVLGFPGNKRTKIKYLALEVEQEQMTVILPKELRHPHRLNLQPGDRVRCIGRSRLDEDAKTVELRAYQIFSLPAASGSIALMPELTLASREKTTGEPLAQTSQGKRPTGSKKPFKILVCRKSGCQKRGGRALNVALEQALRDRGLQDQVTIEYTGCQKRCAEAPTITLMPGKHRYDRVSLQNLSALLDEHFCVPPSIEMEAEGNLPIF